MPKPKKSQNRHPVDRLADIREQMKALEAEEKILKERIIQTGDTVGDDNIAQLKDSTRKTLDRTALEAHYGIETIAQFLKTSSFTTVSLFKKAQPKVDVFS
jgi:hypothetical protein